MKTQTISSEDVRRKFGEIKKQLSFVEFIVTDRGKPIAHISAPPEIRREKLLKFAGAWKGTELENEDVWKDALKKKSRKTDILL